jgi:hypothetical protein
MSEFMALLLIEDVLMARQLERKKFRAINLAPIIRLFGALYRSRLNFKQLESKNSAILRVRVKKSSIYSA